MELRTRVIRGVAIALILPALLLAQAQRPAVLVSAFDFPPNDTGMLSTLRRGVELKTAVDRLKAGVDDPSTIRLLLQNDRVDEGLAMAERVVGGGDPARIIEVVTLIQSSSYSFGFSGDTQGHRERMSVIADAARSYLPKLPREDAARLARRLMNLDSAIARSGSRGYDAQLQQFLADYSGTAEAELANIDLMDRVTINVFQRIDALTAFGLAHAGTIVGAKALQVAAFELGSNAGSPPNEAVGADPTPRFLRLIDLVHTLETGGYPPCEWVERAPGLVVDFHAYQPKYAAENLDRMLAEYRQFLLTHFSLDEQSPLGNSFGYLITSRMAALYKLKGDESGGVEGLLLELARDSKYTSAARYLLALFDNRLAHDKARSAERAVWQKKTDDLLSALAAGTDAYARKALATLAAQQFYDRDDAHAIETYRAYLAKYPQSDWAWVAALRIGQSYAAMGDLAAAVAAYRAAAAAYPANPLAVVLGRVNAARAQEALGQFEEAAADYRAAMSAWDNDFHPLSYTFQSARVPVPGQTNVSNDADVVKSVLADRIASLDAVLKQPGGLLVERGRWQLQQKQWEAARATLESTVAANPKSPIVPEARSLAHRARVERAMALADVEASSQDEAAALKELEAVAKEPYDFGVSAAGIARAAILWKQGEAAAASTAMRNALTAWRASQPAPPAPVKGSLDEDVIAIRNLVFRPLGGGVYGKEHWNAFEWPATMPAFLVVKPEILVKLKSGEMTRTTSYLPLPGLDNVIFATADQIQFFNTMISRLGGNKKGVPASIMQMNAPVGPSLDILKLLNQFFASRPGHWGGWEFETYPVITRVDFLNAERTKALAAVTVGYSGASVVLEKKDGVWIATGLTNQWIT